jgi:hypothetical protein
MRTQEIERLFPAVYQGSLREGEPLAALLGVMEALHQRPERELGSLDETFNPRRTRDAFVPVLATWVDLRWLWSEQDRTVGDLPGGVSPVIERLGLLRELTASAAHLSQWRGTARGLVAFLERATGLAGFDIDESVQGHDGQVRPFHISIIAPAAADDPRIRGLITRIVQMEKPAYVTYELGFYDPNPGS